MIRIHAMPFGADVMETGAVRFRLWAPAAARVTLHIDDIVPQPMSSLASGWFEYVSEQAHAGSRYRYQIDDGLCVADPASRFNPEDVHGASEVVNAAAFDWQDDTWCGRPWEDAILYEIHVGTFTPAGTFAGVEQKLGYLADLGVTVIELMPVADFPGRCNWGYDGTLLFAPDSVYGTPDDLKHLVQSAHQHGMMIILDVVYNHFGPEGNYLHHYAPSFFTERYQTPWGAAINFAGANSRTVRDFYLHNAQYWLEEYHFDGLRLDAAHAIFDITEPDILKELAQTVRTTSGSARHPILVLENERNIAHYLARYHDGYPRYYDAQWNDDMHHAYHVLLTGEAQGYYADYAEMPIQHLGRCLTEGFAYQGEASACAQGQVRGEASVHLPASAFVSFLQNHDQIGNRAFGERLPSLASPDALRAAVALFLLSPSPPMLFMGEEWGNQQPFQFFCDFSGALADAVTAGRRREFAANNGYPEAAIREEIPDPNDIHTFERSKLYWQAAQTSPHREWLSLYRELLTLRRSVLCPRLRGTLGNGYHLLSPTALNANWRLGDGSSLQVYANLGDTPVALPVVPACDPFYCTPPGKTLSTGCLLPYTVAWYLEDSDGQA